jgi:hypothetical protein
MKKFILKLKKNWKDWLATLAGLVTAVAIDLLTIDWKDFDWSKEWMKLVLSIIVAAGGYLSRFKGKVLPKKESTPEGL